MSFLTEKLKKDLEDIGLVAEMHHSEFQGIHYATVTGAGKAVAVHENEDAALLHATLAYFMPKLGVLPCESKLKTEKPAKSL
jgi:hypothetical protein